MDVRSQFCEIIEQQYAILLGSQNIEPNDPDIATRLIDRIISLSNQLTTNHLQHPMVIIEGLTTALETFCAQQDQLDGIHVRFEGCCDEALLLSEQKHHLYYIGKGLISYALSMGASVITLRLFIKEHMLIVTTEANHSCFHDFVNQSDMQARIIRNRMQQIKAAILMRDWETEEVGSSLHLGMEVMKIHNQPVLGDE